MTAAPVIFRDIEARLLAAALAEHDLPIPAVLASAIAIADALSAARTPPSKPILGMSAAEAVEYAAVLARYVPPPGGTAAFINTLVDISNRAADDAADALRAGGVDEIIVALRPRFDAAAAVIHQAAAHGITSATTAQDVIDKHDPKAIAVWQQLPAALAAMARLSRVRVNLSVQLGVAPTMDDMYRLLSGPGIDVLGYVDYSAAFTHPDAPAFGAAGEFYFHNSPTSGIDWLKLAAASGGRLHLNTPAEVRRMIAERTRTRPPAVPIDQTMPRRG